MVEAIVAELVVLAIAAAAREMARKIAPRVFPTS
jgi:hypothetical protein